MMSVGLHCRLAGRPGRAAALERFLDYAAERQSVWICRRVEIARHWRAYHPYPEARLTPSQTPNTRRRKKAMSKSDLLLTSPDFLLGPVRRRCGG